MDNNALIALKHHRVASDFFRAYCHVTTDVLREGGGHPDFAQLKASAYPLTPAVLVQIRTVMAGVAAGDTTLVDLYANKGTADPGLVASALDAIAANEGALFEDEWSIVTNDRAVENAAARHGIMTIKPAELSALIDRGSDSS
ncbi:MAG TPA: hypothetical protein DCQ04_02790 [Actinobacteria bacterium]|nr:hypothetical protein [Actinomycetota bacterium]